MALKLTLAQLQTLAKASGIDLNSAPADPTIAADRDRLHETVTKLKADLAQVIAERDELRTECQRVIAEALAAHNEAEALQRTVDKLRTRAAQPMLANHAPAPKLDDLNSACDRCGRHVGEGQLFHEEETESAVCEHCLAGPAAQRPAAPLISISVRFDGPQGWGTGDKLKAVGGRWVRTSKRGEPMKGYWSLPNNREASDLVAALTAEGRALTLL